MNPSCLLPLVFAFAMAGPAQAENVTAADVDSRIMQGRAVEAVIWGMPAVNTDLMLQAALKSGAKPNDIVFWSRPAN